MLFKAVKDYNRDGEEIKFGLFCGRVTSDGELKETQSGKEYGTASVRAFNNPDGSATFMAIKSFGGYAGAISMLQKGDNILCAGTVSTREYNGKQYTDMMVDFLGKGCTEKSVSPADMAAMAQSNGDWVSTGSSGDWLDTSASAEELPF